MVILAFLKICWLLNKNLFWEVQDKQQIWWQELRDSWKQDSWNYLMSRALESNNLKNVGQKQKIIQQQRILLGKNAEKLRTHLIISI